jgi:uncharacterized SAM-binding protein YcdF (DUF218 family)
LPRTCSELDDDTLMSVALRRMAFVGVGICLLWLAGLIRFAIPPAIESRAAQTDAIVVLTGGSSRLHSGIELLREGKGRKLFVSGVNQQVDLDGLLRSSGNTSDWAVDWASCCVELGHEADNTAGNAVETARWIRGRGFRSLRLVTAWYHMPRSLLEFRRAMPEIDIVAHPVFPDQVKHDQWWRRRDTAGLLVSEYLKYSAALIRPLIDWRQPEEIGKPEQPARAEMMRR